MGLDGLKLLAKMREQFGLNIITEVRDASQVDEVIEHADIVQIGAKAMYDQGILRKCGKANKPILLKRGFGSTLQELVQAAEFILSGGNQDVMLCERGIRTFETKTRFTLDLCGVAYLKEYTNLPVVLDPSHAMGYAYGVPDLARACTAMGVDGLLIEVHPTPKTAKSDASQQLDHNEFRALMATLHPIAAAVGKQIV
jgi:3-deoxy-7-phosphoheptulonate synthase